MAWMEEDDSRKSKKKDYGEGTEDTKIAMELVKIKAVVN